MWGTKYVKNEVGMERFVPRVHGKTSAGVAPLFTSSRNRTRTYSKASLTCLIIFFESAIIEVKFSGINIHSLIVYQVLYKNLSVFSRFRETRQRGSKTDFAILKSKYLPVSENPLI